MKNKVFALALLLLINSCNPEFPRGDDIQGPRLFSVTTGVSPKGIPIEYYVFLLEN